MTNKVTSFTAHQTAEGMRVSFTFSTIDDNGIIVKSNVRRELVVLDSDINAAVDLIFAFLGGKIEQ